MSEQHHEPGSDEPAPQEPTSQTQEMPRVDVELTFPEKSRYEAGTAPDFDDPYRIDVDAILSHADLPTDPGPITRALPLVDAIKRQQVKASTRSLEARLIGGERTMKRREVAQKAGISLHSARKLWRALGFPNHGEEDVAFTQNDLQALLTIVDNVRSETLTEEAAISVTRSIGQMTDRMVVWQIEALVEDMIQNQGLSDPEARRKMVELLPELIAPIEELLVYTWRRNLNAAIQRLGARSQAGVVSGNDDDAPLPLARAVGFADLVSYTSLSRRMNERTLAQLVQRFENKAAEIISVGGGRLVKTIGDEVLFVAETPQAGAQIALTLAQELNADEALPAARVSVVWGRVLSRLGDIYGPTVNLAARLTALAEPGQILTDALTAATLKDDARFVVQELEATSVRGFGDINPFDLAHGEGGSLVID
ncbi:adenylate/guanylate cyclase domain-containing protein [Zhihengliuella flava]|uniref:Adenylate cyclase n=1 Tax=Zhihengliuella flava TaxID=1285193 RepID=A0A931GEB5_9MICC|nr:adenylate/guanylate cyclase domain-containing protein [Zhihengliuella flava]MBG6083915.1 adenylate cyclase [Zhihengliuella flava]